MQKLTLNEIELVVKREVKEESQVKDIRKGIAIGVALGGRLSEEKLLKILKK